MSEAEAEGNTETADLQEQVVAHATAIREAYGGTPDFEQMVKLLEDRRFVPYRIIFAMNDEALQVGEFGWATQIAPDRSEGYLLYINPHYRNRDADLPLLIAYQLVVPIWGPEASYREAERFGATLLDIPQEEYYERICALADELPKPTQSTNDESTANP